MNYYIFIKNESGRQLFLAQFNDLKSAIVTLLENMHELTWTVEDIEFRNILRNHHGNKCKTVISNFDLLPSRSKVSITPDEIRQYIQNHPSMTLLGQLWMGEAIRGSIFGHIYDKNACKEHLNSPSIKELDSILKSIGATGITEDGLVING